MTAHAKSTPIQAYVRLAGAIYLFIIGFGGYAEGVIMSKLLVDGDITATMHNILASSREWNLTALGNLIVPVIAVFQIWIEYILFRPVSRNLAQLFVLLNIANVSVEAVSKLFMLMVMPILHSKGLAANFGELQVYSFAGMALIAHNICFTISLVFFGLVCLVEGYLIFRSAFMPKFLGILLQSAGIAYLGLCFSQLFAPAVADTMAPMFFLAILIGEGALCLWFLIKGVDVEKWRHLAEHGTIR